MITYSITNYSMKRAAILTATISMLALTGCSTMQTGANHRPIVDGGDLTNYEQDLASCQQLAQQRDYLNDETKADAAIGAVIGALVGSGGDRGDILAGAAIGGAVGATGNALDTRTERKNIVINCMAQRGYRTVESTTVVY